MVLKNCLKNAGSVIKMTAQQTFEDALATALKNGKVSENRRDELLAKIMKVKDTDHTAFAGAEWSIQLTADENDTSSIEVDLLAHYIVSNENEPDTMTVNYAAAKTTIKSATTQYTQKSIDKLNLVITKTVEKLKLPGGAEELQTILANLEEQGKNQLMALLPE